MPRSFSSWCGSIPTTSASSATCSNERFATRSPGLYHRAYFLSQIGSLAERYAASGIGMAILMLDVDHFKQINDRYGHVAGDDVLREVAAVIRESTRAEDLVARYGGEEFVIALPVSLASLAVRRAERIRVELAARTIAAGSLTSA